MADKPHDASSNYTSMKTVSRCSTSKTKHRELEVLEKLDSLLTERESILRRKLEVLQQCDSDEDDYRSSDYDNPSLHRQQRVGEWVESSRRIEVPSLPLTAPTPAPRTAPTPAPRSATPPDMRPPGENGFEKLADALQRSIKTAVSGERTKLPTFDGNIHDWLQFKSSYEESTKRYNLTSSENLNRIRLALKGEARTAVAALLHSCSNPESVIEALQLRFGNPTRLIKAQIAEIRSSPRVIGSDPSELSVFSAKLNNCVAAIRALGMLDYLKDTELYESCMCKLNVQLRLKFLQYADENVTADKCVFVCLAEFIKKEAELAQRFLPESNSRQPGVTPTAGASQSHSSPATWRPKYQVNAANGNVTCSLCNETHTVVKCPKFLELPVNDRYEWAKSNKKCFRCLIYSHPAKNCKISKFTHRLLQTPKPNIDSAVNNDQINNNDGVNVATPVFTANITPTKGALLKVVPITIHGPKGTVKTYALLDEGSSISLIDQSLAEKVGASGTGQMLNIQGVGTSQSFVSKSVKISVESMTGSRYDLNIRTMPNLTLQSQFINKNSLVQYSHVKAKEHIIPWYSVGTPQMIIGQDYSFLIVTRQLYMGRINEPVVSETLLGLVIHGSVENMRSAVLASHTVVAHARLSCDDDLHGLVKESFNLDSLGLEARSRSNPEVDRAVKLLEINTRKMENSCTWETGLLWASDDNEFPATDSKALKRFYALEKIFHKNPELQQKYSLQMNKLIDLKFAEPYKKQHIEKDGWVLSHFAAINPNKPDKVRIVFDCADKVQGKSLNDYLLTGPELLQPLLGVLWRFRRAPVALAADIKDMFLKIKIKEEDQKFQKFYWREIDDSAPPQLFVMTSMLFGAKCSPSSAIYVKNRNAECFIDEYPEAVSAIQHNHYCDDYLDSFVSEQKAVEMAKTVSKIHAEGNFDICNWTSNSEVVLQSIPEEKRASGSVQLASGTPAEREKTLGMMWQPSTDTLGFNLSMKRVPVDVSSGLVRPTKRQMLGVLMSVFDPIGLLSHFTIRGRILLQDVWRSGIGWDTPLKDSEYSKWQQWVSDLQLIRECSIPRCYVTRSEDATIQLHTYCDASNKAYAAACYLRYQYEDEIQTALVAAKARVTPLKPCSVPRLELQAAVLGARLAKTVISEHQLPIQEQYYWTDSITTLAWIRSDPRNYKPFVGHRLAAIDDLTSAAQWRWVPTALNPADIATRDVSKLDMFLDGPWFSGPDYLKKKEREWPVENTKIIPATEASCEEKHKVNVLKNTEKSLPDVSRFSSWKRLINATAYMLLFIDRCKKIKEKNFTLQLLQRAENMWILKSQEQDFPSEITCLKEGKNLPQDSKILQLSPVLDDDGIMRLGGRIDRAPNVAQQMKRPIILSGQNPYTKLLIHHYHKMNNHGSTETVVNEMRQKYWVISLRSTVRSVSHNCQFCRIQRAKAFQPPMGDLPLPRLEHHKRPFTYCGLDYFGPMEVSIGRRREKRWGALFTCLVTRAVHMEVAASLSADSVIMAIRRMITRRGSPTAIYSDNGTNFRGADSELQKAWSTLDKDALSSTMINKGIDWHYIPATAAHMGGAWERLVQSIKRALNITLKERAPKEETLSTLIIEAEQSVNSRPLTFVSVDPRDPEALTPYHFLIGSSSIAPVPGKFDDKDLMLRKQWKVAQRLADLFWSRWIREYLPTMLDRKLKGTVDQEVKEGQLVIIVDQNSPRNVWPRGIISKTFPGQDGKVRVVDVRTAGGTFRRPVNKIIILPVARDSDSSQDVDASADCMAHFLSRLEQLQRRARDGEVCNSASALPINHPT